MKMGDVFPSNYIKADDLNGKQIQVRIESVTKETVGKDTRPVIYFANAQKGLVCNRTNWASIAAQYGEDSDAWLGKVIILYPSKCQNPQGATVSCIRVMPFAAQQPVAPLTGEAAQRVQQARANAQRPPVSPDQEQLPATEAPFGSEIPF